MWEGLKHRKKRPWTTVTEETPKRYEIKGVHTRQTDTLRSTVDHLDHLLVHHHLPAVLEAVQ